MNAEQIFSAKPMLFTGVDGWFYLYALTLAAGTIVYLVSYFGYDDISIIDISWGLLPLVPLNALLIDRIINVGGDSVTISMIITYVLVHIWGLRLAWHIAARHKGEDARYVEMRKIWASCPAVARALVVYFNVFVF